MTELFYAIVLVCNLTFNVCDLHQTKEGYKDISACNDQLRLGMQAAKLSLPTLGEGSGRYSVLGWCGPRLG